MDALEKLLSEMDEQIFSQVHGFMIYENEEEEI